MTLEQYYFIGELVGAGALIISLVYVGVQVKLGTKATKAGAAQSFVDTNNGFVGLINQSPTLADILFRGSQGMANLHAGETIQFSAFHDCCFISFESYYFMSQEGVLDERLWDTYTHALVDLLHQKGMQEWWQARSHWFSKDFVEHVDRLRDDVASKPMHFRAEG